ncbi:transposase, MuDR, partial [Tanacetum coccineum]
NDPNLFSLKFNHGGGFSYVYGPNRTRAPRHVYKGGNADWFDDVDADGFSVIEASCMLKELAMCISLKLIELFIEHPVDKCVLDNSVIDVDGLDNDNVDGLKSSNAGLGTHENEALDNDNVDLETDGIDIWKKSSDDNEDGYENEDSDENENSDENEDSEESEEKWVGSTEPQPQVEKNDQFVYEECDLEDFDSHIDPDDDEAERKKALRKIIKCHKLVDGHLYTENFYVSQTFPKKVMIKDMAPRISVKKRMELYLTKNDKERVRAECKGLVLVFSNIGPSGESVYNAEGPTDGPSGSQSQPCGIDSNKKKTKKWGKPMVEILNCPWLILFKRKDPDTTVKIDVERNYEPDSPTRKFRRINVCLGALKSGFKAGQRDLLGLDGCFMSGPFPIQILIAVGVDPNNGIYPLAYVVVEYETKKSWLWFLDCFGDDLELFRNSNFTFVIDRQKGIIPALAETFPAAEHRFKINPCNGPDLWPLSDSLIILTPSDYHTPIGRPPKKRKKSSAELYDRMVKDGKLSRAGKTVTCLKYGQKGHNSRPCIVNPSAPTVNVNPSTQQNMSHSARM